MPTVDDLIISVRIDDTSNLGKLQKQLTALVGSRGEKKLDLGALSPNIKRDIELIKDRILRFTPTVLVGENIKEAALNLAGDLRKNKNLQNVILQRYNINIDKYESFIEELFNISIGISKMNSDQQKGFIAEMDHFRKIADMDKGRRKVFISRLTRMMLEAGFHEKVVDVFREAGIKLLSKPPMFELTKKSIGKGFDDVIKEAELKEPEKFINLKEIFYKNSDTLKGISEAYEYMKGEVFDITEITQDMVENDKDLRMIIVAQVASAIEKSNWMVEQFYKAGKSFFTKGKAFAVGGPAFLDSIVHSFSTGAIKQLGLEHVVGDKIDEAMVNALTEFKTVAGKSEVNYELTKRMIKQGYEELYFIVEEHTDEAKNAIEEFLSKEKHKGKRVGLYKLVPRLAEKLRGIETNLDDLEKTARASLEKKEELMKKQREKLTDEFEKKFDEETAKEIEEKDEMRGIMAALQDLDDISKDIKEVEGNSSEEIKKAQLEEKRQLDDLLRAMGNLKETTDDTNEEVKKKDIDNEPKVVKDDE